MRYIFITLLMLSMAGNVFAHVKKNHKHSHSRVQKHVVTPPAFTTESYLIADSSGQIILEHDSNLQRPIASISKLMVGLLAASQDLDEALPIPVKRTVQSGIPYKHRSLTRRELLTLSLVKSDNFAAQILCLHIHDCINAMNNKAAELGMLHTRFVEPTGLSKENVSTASDLLKLMLASSSSEVITSLSSLPSAEIHAGKKVIKINNTNPLTRKLNVFLSKTGFTNPAGGCISMIIGDSHDRRIIILLGSKNTKTRIVESLRLYKNSL